MGIAASSGCGHAQRNSDQRRKQQSTTTERHAERQSGGDQLGDLRIAHTERWPEIALHKPA